MALHNTDPEFMARLDHFMLEEVPQEPGQTLPEPTRHLAILATLLGCQGLEVFRGQREMITFCFLAAQGGCEAQLTGHAKGNMNLGQDKAFLLKVISQCLPYLGYPRSLNAVACVEKAAE